MKATVLFLPGDGIGPEVSAQAKRVLALAAERWRMDLSIEEGLIGGAALDARGEPLPTITLEAARAADAVFLGAVGGPKWDAVPAEKRPEAGLLSLRKGLGLYANLRPAQYWPMLEEVSSLRPERVREVNLMIVRELTGGLYYGEPRGLIADPQSGEEAAVDTSRYRRSEIERVARLAFRLAERHGARLLSVDKANVLSTSRLWRNVVTELAAQYPKVSLKHGYVDAVAYGMVAGALPAQVVLTENLFGDILSDLAGGLIGSLGLLPSASLGEGRFGLFEPVHGSAPDIAGQDLADPLGAILSVAMMLRYSLRNPAAARDIEQAVHHVLADGYYTKDLAGGRDSSSAVGCAQMADLILRRMAETHRGAVHDPDL